MQAALTVVLCAVTAFNLAQCAFFPNSGNTNPANNPLTDYLKKQIQRSFNNPENKGLKTFITDKYPSCEARKLILATCRTPLPKILSNGYTKLETKKEAESRCTLLKEDMEKTCALEKESVTDLLLGLVQKVKV